MPPELIDLIVPAITDSKALLSFIHLNRNNYHSYRSDFECHIRQIWESIPIEVKRLVRSLMPENIWLIDPSVNFVRKAVEICFGFGGLIAVPLNSTHKYFYHRARLGDRIMDAIREAESTDAASRKQEIVNLNRMKQGLFDGLRDSVTQSILSFPGNYSNPHAVVYQTGLIIAFYFLGGKRQIRWPSAERSQYFSAVCGGTALTLNDIYDLALLRNRDEPRITTAVFDCSAIQVFWPAIECVAFGHNDIMMLRDLGWELRAMTDMLLAAVKVVVRDE